MMKRTCSITLVLIALLMGGLILSSSSPQALAKQSALSVTENSDPVARLQQRLDRGEVSLEYQEAGGWLASVLTHLRVPVASQGLVFSRTSLQGEFVSPANPRAIYFNDEVYVGWIRNAPLIEISAVDPQIGAVFYSLEQKAANKPRFVRQDQCMRCHVSANTRYIPGHFVRSLYPESMSNAIQNPGSFITDHTSPFSQRWGGWYVTGTHGKTQHLGNLPFLTSPGEGGATENTDNFNAGNLTSLAKKVDLRDYASPHSDIVALMTLAHQTQMHNLIVWLGYETRMALREQDELEKSGRQPKGRLAAGVEFKLDYAVNETLKYMLYTDEARFNSPISGTSGFAEEFARLGPIDSQGRSLREFDLQGRLFRYPCSYLIYSEIFDQIPQPALDRLYRKLWQVLNGQAEEKEFVAIAEGDRQAILEILFETKKNLPEYFRAGKVKSYFVSGIKKELE